VASRPEQEPCATCGATARTYWKSLDATLTFHSFLTGKVRGARCARRRPRVEVAVGDSLDRATGTWNRLERLVDRGKGLYRELVTDRAGSVLHRCEEPLSEHMGHGSAKWTRRSD